MNPDPGRPFVYCPSRHGVEPTVHDQLTEVGVRKGTGRDFDPQEDAEVLPGLLDTLEEAMSS